MDLYKPVQHDDDIGMKLFFNMDANVWAEEFCKINPIADKDFMRSWFANSLMCGWDCAMDKIKDNKVL